MTVATFVRNLLIRMRPRRQRGTWRPLGTSDEATGQRDFLVAPRAKTSAHATRGAGHFPPSPSDRSTRPTPGRHPQPLDIDPAELRELIRRQRERA